jgi:hypothetical protein
MEREQCHDESTDLTPTCTSWHDVEYEYLKLEHATFQTQEAIALLRVRSRSSRQTAGLTPYVSLTQHPQIHSPSDGTAHAPCLSGRTVVPRRANTPTQSGLATRIGGEERPIGGGGGVLACVS